MELSKLVSSPMLSPEALAFVEKLERKFGPTRLERLRAREVRQKELNSGIKPDFLKYTQEIKNSHWQIAPVPKDLLDRRVEITGPVDRKMVINALNSGAQVFMADFEDSHSPTWTATVSGQQNLFDAVRRQIEFQSSDGKKYELSPNPAVLMVRPRGWHLTEKHFFVDGKPISASLFDFGIYFFHNARELLKRGSGPYFYLPKMESHLEARLWNDVFNFAESELSIPAGSIKATVLIETIMAAFEMDEILYELKDHSAGLNCGRWDYIFSVIKKFAQDPDFVMPDRSQITMGVHFLKSYSELLIKTCHRRGAHAMGGMAAQIPIKNDPEAHEIAMNKVRQDKLREVKAGHDGTWVAHPALVPIAKAVFDQAMPEANQISRSREEVQVSAGDLLTVPEGSITPAGFRTNVNVALLYLEAWLNGLGCVPLYHLMEDAATAEISRAQIWQWIKHPRGKFTDGTKINAALFEKVIHEELNDLEKKLGGDFGRRKFSDASKLLSQLVLHSEFVDFLTIPAYDILRS